MDTPTKTTPIVNTARERLERVSLGLAQTLGTEPAALLLTGTATNALLAHFGRDGAVRYLRLLADEIESSALADEPPARRRADA